MFLYSVNKSLSPGLGYEDVYKGINLTPTEISSVWMIPFSHYMPHWEFPEVAGC